MASHPAQSESILCDGISEERGFLNRALLALYAFETLNFVSVDEQEHMRCCDGLVKGKFDFQWNNRHHTFTEKLLDALATIISFRSGRQPVALIRDPESMHLELVIASEQCVTQAQRSDIERYFALLAKVSPVRDSLSNASDSEADLVVHAYCMCRGDEVDKIMGPRATWLDRVLPQIAKAIEEFRARADEEEEGASHKVKILTQAQQAISSVIAYRAAADAEVKDALVPLLHCDLTECIPALYRKREFTVLDCAVDGGICAVLSEALLLSRALDDMIQVARNDRGFRALLDSGVRYHWIDPDPVMTHPITINDEAFEGIRSRVPALKDVPLGDRVRKLERKLKAGSRFPTNQNIFYDPANLPATFEVHVSTHCEAALIGYLADRDMESTVYIACARAACYSCHLLVEATNDVEGRDKFRLGPFNGAIHCGWKFPSSVPHAVAVEKAMVTKIGVDLKQAIDECYKVREPLEFEWWPGS